MGEYKVMLTPRAIKDMDRIYKYIKDEFMELEIAKRMLVDIEDAVNSLYAMPYRGAERKTGRYADSGYRQLFAKNYTIVYRIEEQDKGVIILTVRYTASEF